MSMLLSDLDSKSISDDDFSSYQEECIKEIVSGKGPESFATDSLAFRKAVFPLEKGETSTEPDSIYPVDIHTLASIPHKSIQAVSAALWLHVMPCFGSRVRTDMISFGEPIVNVAELRRAKVTVDPKLKVSREKFLEESLLAPSGPYLSWLCMKALEGDEQD